MARNLPTSFEDEIETCVQVLKNGGTILYPTDTIWGLGCNATNAKAIDRVFAIKKRPKEKSMIILLDQMENLNNYVHFDNALTLPSIAKPLTVVYPYAKNLAQNCIAADGSVAIRIVNDDFCKTLIAAFGKPIISTSANFSGAATPRYFDEIAEELKNNVDYVVHHRREDRTPTEPSAIYKLGTDGTFSILRN